MHKDILKLAIPNILSNLSVPLLSSVDTALMGQLSASLLGAMGLGSMCFSFLYWNFGFLRMGTTGVTAQAFGAKRTKLMAVMLWRSAFLALIIGLLIWLLQHFILIASEELLDVGEKHMLWYRQYFNVRIWAAPASLLLFALWGWSFGMQNVIIPLVGSISVNLVNIGLSYYFVNELSMEARGVALGTVYAQYFGVVLALLLIYAKYKSLLKFRHLDIVEVFRWSDFSDFLQINKDIFIRTVLLTLAFGFFYRQSSSMGEIILAANIVMMQYVNWMSYGIDGFAYAAESLVGRFFGARDRNRLNRVVKFCFVWSGALAALYVLAFVFFKHELIGVFTEDQFVRSQVLVQYGWLLLIPFLATASYVWDGVYVGLTASKEMRDTMFWSFVVYLVVFFTSRGVWGSHAIWAALSSFLLVRGLLQTWVVQRKKLLSI